jgi:hypothetical protein
MRRTSYLLIVLCVCSAFAVSADVPDSKKAPLTPAEQRRAAQRRDDDLRDLVLHRAWEVRPRRRDTPLRALNISDDEMREVQVVTERFLPRAYVNVSPVVTGCPCEEGPDCKDQLYVMATANGATLGVQLSKGRNGWVVGDVQKWWLRYQRLLDQRSEMDWKNFQDAEMVLVLDFPTCSTPAR